MPRVPSNLSFLSWAGYPSLILSSTTENTGTKSKHKKKKNLPFGLGLPTLSSLGMLSENRPTIKIKNLKKHLIVFSSKLKLSH
jgi:hypothetical protein